VVDPERVRRAGMYAAWKLRKRGGRRRDEEQPPYLPGGESLEARSLRMDSRHCVDLRLLSRRQREEGEEVGRWSGGGGGVRGLQCKDVTHYDAHNLYGIAEMRVTAQALVGEAVF
jgi:hypothetical protein